MNVYFVSWIIPGPKRYYGNATVHSNCVGEALIEDIIEKITSVEPDAVVLSINKV